MNDEPKQPAPWWAEMLKRHGLATVLLIGCIWFIVLPMSDNQIKTLEKQQEYIASQVIINTELMANHRDDRRTLVEMAADVKQNQALVRDASRQSQIDAKVQAQLLAKIDQNTEGQANDRKEMLDVLKRIDENTKANRQ